MHLYTYNNGQPLEIHTGSSVKPERLLREKGYPFFSASLNNGGGTIALRENSRFEFWSETKIDEKSPQHFPSTKNLKLTEGDNLVLAHSGLPNTLANLKVPANTVVEFYDCSNKDKDNALPHKQWIVIGPDDAEEEVAKSEYPESKAFAEKVFKVIAAAVEQEAKKQKALNLVDRKPGQGDLYQLSRAAQILKPNSNAETPARLISAKLAEAS